MPHQSDVTELLLAWSGGEEAAAAVLMDAVYDELRRLAGSFLLRERRDHSLAATALVNEAYLKLVDQRRVRWQNRAHFFAIASHVMRRLLVDHARARGASKRGNRVTISRWPPRCFLVQPAWRRRPLHDARRRHGPGGVARAVDRLLWNVD